MLMISEITRRKISSSRPNKKHNSTEQDTFLKKSKKDVSYFVTESNNMRRAHAG